jgi:putative hydrolase
MSSLLRGDFHVHSTFSDDAVSTIAENIAAAASLDLLELRLVDHVRRDTTWVPEFAAAVAAERVPDGLTVRTGVEAKILDSTGTVDVPPGLTGVDSVLIADHQFPGVGEPWSPRETRERLQSGLSMPDALELLVSGLIGAMANVAAMPVERGQLAHCFSILPKVGLSEDDLSDEHLAAWAAAAAGTRTLVEVNEKWGCPGPRALRAALSAGAELVASSDSHVASDVGRYVRVPEIVGQL